MNIAEKIHDYLEFNLTRCLAPFARRARALWPDLT